MLVLLPGSLWGKARADGWLEATRSGAEGQEYVLQTAAVFNTTEEKFLVVAYQLSGSDSVAFGAPAQEFSGATGSSCSRIRAHMLMGHCGRMHPSSSLPAP